MMFFLYLFGGLLAAWIFLWILQEIPRLLARKTTEEWNKELNHNFEQVSKAADKVQRTNREEKVLKAFEKLSDEDFKELFAELMQATEGECQRKLGVGLLDALHVYKQAEKSRKKP